MPTPFPGHHWGGEAGRRDAKADTRFKSLCDGGSSCARAYLASAPLSVHADADRPRRGVGHTLHQHVRVVAELQTVGSFRGDRSF